MIAALRPALREFNAGRFFECHEVLEDLLETTDRDDWDFVLGLIQVAVGYHKLTHRYAGGEKLLAMGLDKLALYGASYGGLDVETLRRAVRADLARAAAARASGAAPVPPAPPRLVPARGKGCSRANASLCVDAGRKRSARRVVRGASHAPRDLGVMW